MKLDTHTIDVKWIHDPTCIDLHGVSTPILFIDKQLCKLKATGGCRLKYFYNYKFIVKIDDNEGIHSIKNIVKLYKSLDKEDIIYFPKLLSYNIKLKYMVQEYINFSKRLYTNHDFTIIKKLKSKYDLQDVDSYSLPGIVRKSNINAMNWGINQKTGNVSIFDFIIC